MGKRKKKKKHDIIQLAADVIRKRYWPHADLKGRTWGPILKNALYGGSHVTTGEDGDIVVIYKEKYLDKNGKKKEKLVVRHFIEVSTTDYGEEMIESLEEANLM